MRPTRGPYILQLGMGPSYFWSGLTPPDLHLFCTLPHTVHEITYLINRPISAINNCCRI